jgi:hypothetical protein
MTQKREREKNVSNLQLLNVVEGMEGKACKRNKERNRLKKKKKKTDRQQHSERIQLSRRKENDKMLPAGPTSFCQPFTAVTDIASICFRAN